MTKVRRDCKFLFGSYRYDVGFFCVVSISEERLRRLVYDVINILSRREHGGKAFRR